MYGQLVFNKSAEAFQWGENSLLNKWPGTIRYTKAESIQEKKIKLYKNYELLFFDRHC